HFLPSLLATTRCAAREIRSPIFPTHQQPRELLSVICRSPPNVYVCPHVIPLCTGRFTTGTPNLGENRVLGTACLSLSLSLSLFPSPSIHTKLNSFRKMSSEHIPKRCKTAKSTSRTKRMPHLLSQNRKCWGHTAPTKPASTARAFRS
ncbi:unnamed protein product, partial [Ectocarpus sp. 6 AP-2014]